MLPCGYIEEHRPKPKPHHFKVPIPSRAWFSRETVRQPQRFGYIAATLVSNPSGGEPRPPTGRPYSHKWTPATLARDHG